MSHRPDLGFFDEGHDLASAGFYADALGAEGEARMLPPAAFRSLPFTLLEDETIWTRGWICVGSHEEIPSSGDLLPFTVGTHGIHVQRTEDGLKARFNKAQHGGCRAVPLQCQTGAKTKCSFTSCGYSRDRRAIPASELGDGTPAMHQYLGLRPERLLTAHVKSWGPLIFVNLDVAPAWAEQSLSILNRATDAFGNHKPTRSAEVWLEYAANWKILGGALADGAPAGEDDRGGWIVSETTLADGTQAVTAWLFPNLVLIATEQETAVVVLQQTAIGTTLCRLSVYGERERSIERWREEIALRAKAGEAEHFAAARWGTSHRPETIGHPLPLQSSAIGRWMQRTLAARVAAASFAPIEEPLFQNPRV